MSLPTTHDLTIIAEKPSLAEAIAFALAKLLGLGKPTKDTGRGCWVVGPHRVTWLFGHMYELAEPAKQDPKWASWDPGLLPINPEKWLLLPHDDKKSHIRSIQALLKSADVVVNAGDAAREGQLLVDELLVVNGWDPFNDRTLRLWVKSVAEKDLMEALRKMAPNAERRALYDAAICRQRGDYIHGLSFTRLYTRLASNVGANVTLNIGRVQTPTLRIVVDRDLQIEKFRAVDHFMPTGYFVHEKGRFKAEMVIPAEMDGLDEEGRLVKKEVADAIIEKIKGQTGKVTSFEANAKTQSAPLPFSLSALQAACSAKFGLTAKRTLEIAQKLYEEYKVTTYPRSDSQYLPSALREEVPAIMAALGKHPSFSGVVSGADQSLRSDAWNDSKVSDHHGIVPTVECTPERLGRLQGIELKVFMLVAQHFLAQFYPCFRYKALSAEVQVEGYKFRATGRQIIDQGWKVVFGAEKNEGDEGGEDEGEEQTLPTMARGDDAKVENAQNSAKKTKPPARFTDGTLIAAMANIHRFVENPRIKNLLKEASGLGTEATRAETLEKLIRGKFLERKGKNQLVSTELGRSLIATVMEEIKDPGLTALWEDLLTQVAQAQLAATDFMNKLVRDVTARITTIRDSGNIQIRGVKLVTIEGHGETCPKCQKGTMVTQEIFKGEHKGKRFLRCSNQPDCDHRAWPRPKIAPLPGHGKDCPACGKGKMDSKEITAKDGKKYQILSCTNYPECKHSEWPEKKIDPVEGHGTPCPKCGEGQMLTRQVTKDGPHKGKKYLGCSRYKEGCQHTSWPQPKVDPIEGHGKDCAVCGKGKMLTKEITAKTGKKYKLLSCNNYPECKNSEWPQPKVDPLPGHGKDCPECKQGKMMTKEITTKKGEKMKLLSCNKYPACNHSEWPERKGGFAGKGGGRREGKRA